MNKFYIKPVCSEVLIRLHETVLTNSFVDSGIESLQIEDDSEEWI